MIFPIFPTLEEIVSNEYKQGQRIENWDRKTAERIVDILKSKFLGEE